jgi:phosphatidylglycerophosphatase A
MIFYILKNISTLYLIGYLNGSGTLASILGIYYIYTINSYIDNIYIKILIFNLLYIVSYISISISVNEFKSNDPKEIVIDEFLAMSLATIFLENSMTKILIFFILFRLFDITKILYIKKIEYISAKRYPVFSIIIDDIISALYSLSIISIATYYRHIAIFCKKMSYMII